MIDIERIIATHLISNHVANGNVIVLNQAVEYNPPAVMVQLVSLTGNKNEGIFQATVYATCITNDEYDTLNLADTVRDLLDGYGDADIEHIEFISMIPQRSIDVSPATHSAVLTLNVWYQG